MMNLNIKYSTLFKELPPQPIRLTDVTWAGVAEKKMTNGSEVQPWHCLPFIEGSTYGLELVYPYETECHVIGAGGTIHFDWDFTKEPDNALLVSVVKRGNVGFFLGFSARTSSKIVGANV
jgi:hypothetical protein